jgi:hypothetical protein
MMPADGASLVLEAAPGVDANIDAVVQGQAGNAERAKQAGIVVHSCATCRTTVRNLTVRNWLAGLRIRGHSQVLLDDVRAEGNLNTGIRIRGHSRVAVRNSAVTATGYRKDAGGAGTPSPGVGIRAHDRTRTSVVDSVVSGSFRAGIVAPRDRIVLRRVQLFNNHPNLRLYR